MKSGLEDKFAMILIANSIPYEREVYIHNKRKWRFDFALNPDLIQVKKRKMINPRTKHILIEIQGGIYSRGRHNRASGMTADCEKENYANLMGHCLLKFTTNHFRDLKYIMEFILLYKKNLTKK